MNRLKFSVKCFTGHSYKVELLSSATGLELKQEIQKQDKDLAPYLQRLFVGSSRVNKPVLDNAKLTECGIQDGSVVNLMVLVPFKLYLQGINGSQHIITIPSSEPEEYTISALYDLVEEKVGHKMDNYQVNYRGKTVLVRSDVHTLSDFGVEKEATLIITKVGILIKVNNPMVDVCFLVDCTGSMQKHIDGVKDTIIKLQESLVAEYMSCDLKFSFVRYTDYDVSVEKRTSYLDFTSDTEVFQKFVGKIIAKGGGDSPEDIMGGFQLTFSKLSWRSIADKVLIHIADCPCHGIKYHEFGAEKDTYSDGDPANISHESMMQKIVDLNIQYWFGYIYERNTRKMIRVFNDSLQLLSAKQSLIRQFNAKDTSDIGCSILKSVTDSIYSAAASKQES